MQRIIDGTVFRSHTANEEDTYGVVFRTERGDMITLSDVDPDRKVAAEIAERLTGEVTDEQQLRYLAEDLLGVLYDGQRS